jgi:leucyl aminopeptidase
LKKPRKAEDRVADRLSIEVTSRAEWDGDLLISPAHAEEGSVTGRIGSEAGEIHFVERFEGQERAVQQTAVVSLGAVEKCTNEIIRRVGGMIANWLVKQEIYRTGIALAPLQALPIEGAIQAVCEGLLLGAFRFDRHKTSVSDRKTVVVHLLAENGRGDLAKLACRVSAVIGGVNLARDWSHEPPNRINPVTLAERAERLAAGRGLVCTVLDERKLEGMGAGGILSVGAGSKSPPRLVILEWPGRGAGKRAKPIALVGKAITFDTGGYSIKTKAAMPNMKFDKCAGMNIIGLMQVIADLAINPRVVGIVAAAENMISGMAYRPSDIIDMLSGKTVEVISTDAEGRLILADALAYAQKQYQPRALIDLATLTSGMVTALGRVRAGIMANDDSLAEALIASGERTHELLWRFPLDDAYADQIKGDDSDLKNSGGTLATPVIGGVFLKQFVKDDVPWAHIDIAGTGRSMKELPYRSKGATGFGVRLLIDYLEGLDR